jgi:breast cancer 2 susceptibility protein
LDRNSPKQHKFPVFSKDSQSTNSTPPVLQGPIDAFRELKVIGGSLATQEWVDNHWFLILWKLAGMVTLDPENELDVNRKRWSWTETMHQLRYRCVFFRFLDDTHRVSFHSYEKELYGGARPALRLIAAQDTSAGLHMVLCVSDITWSEGGIGEDGLPVVPHPTLELTDGWYCLRARVDEVLARATRRGVIRVGRKIAVSGASVRLSVSAATHA